ncbi:hypothetical protein C8R46DRAFT_1116886, partial [Mycena filopes]
VATHSLITTTFFGNPHSSCPLSRAAPFDIEDLGTAFSAGLTCPQNNLSFNLFTGMGDYRLK